MILRVIDDGCGDCGSKYSDLPTRSAVLAEGFARCTVHECYCIGNSQIRPAPAPPFPSLPLLEYQKNDVRVQHSYSTITAQLKHSYSTSDLNPSKAPQLMPNQLRAPTPPPPPFPPAHPQRRRTRADPLPQREPARNREEKKEKGRMGKGSCLCGEIAYEYTGM